MSAKSLQKWTVSAGLALTLCGWSSEPTEQSVKAKPPPKPTPTPTPCTNEEDGDYVGCGIAKTTYGASDPISGLNFLYKYFPVATPEDSCDNNICECAASGSIPAWNVSQGRVYAKRADAPPDCADCASRTEGNGFGLHLVNVPIHWTTGGKSVKEVEEIFDQKLGDMRKFDSFMDYNTIFGTSDLQGYKDNFAKNKVPYYAAEWSADSKTWTSILVQVPHTQMILELVQQTSLTYKSNEGKPNKIEQRVPTTTLLAHESRVGASSTQTAYLKPLVVNRAASEKSMAELEEFYVTGMGTTMTYNSADKAVAKKCFLWPGATVNVCFTQRPSSSTKGSFKVSDFENMLFTVHNNIVRGHPLCGFDQWEDNHYAFDSDTWDPSGIVDYVNEKNPLHYCWSMGPNNAAGQSVLHYVWDPTGWGIQLDVPFTAGPTDCATSSSSQMRGVVRTDPGNPACSVDTSVCPNLAEPANVVV